MTMTMTSSGKQTFYMWKLLASTYPGPYQFRSISKYRSVHIQTPRMPIREYLHLMADDDHCNSNGNGNGLNWGTVLSLNTYDAKIPELVDIAAIVKNLVALCAYAPSTSWSYQQKKQAQTLEEEGVYDSQYHPYLETTLNDRIIRSWCELARSPSSSSSSACTCSTAAFMYLRVLSLCNQRDVSREGLRCLLLSLPALSVVLITDCPGLGLGRGKRGDDDEEEVEDGWVVASNSNVYNRGHDDHAILSLYEWYEKTRYDGSQSDIGLGMVNSGYACKHGQLHNCTLDTPILDFRLGVQSSIRQEQPSTTVLLRKSKTLQKEGDQYHQQKSTNKGKGSVAKNRGKAKDLTNVLAEFL